MERKLHRIEGGNSVIGGVAAGLAEYFGIDVAIVRVIFVIGIFTPLTLAYFILWVVLPQQYGKSNLAFKDSTNNLNPFSTMTNGTQNSSQIGGIILVALGSIFLADEFIPWFDFDKLWPLVLIGIGIYILTKDKNPKSTTVNEIVEEKEEATPKIVDDVLNGDSKPNTNS